MENLVTKTIGRFEDVESKLESIAPGKYEVECAGYLDANFNRSGPDLQTGVRCEVRN